MSDEYFYEAQRKILTVYDGDYVAEGIVATARKIYNEAQALKPPHLTFTDDALSDLAAVMRHHKMEFKVDATGSGLFEPSFSVDCADKYGDLFSIDGFLTLTADDIKSEQ